MFSTKDQQQTFPAMPPSHSAGDYETRDYYANQDAPRPVPNQTPYLTPYLGLRARLSQIWLNRWTVLILLILVRVLLAVASIDTNLGSARAKALSACTKVESAGSAMASMPHYMSKGVNELTASSIDMAVNGLMSMLGLTVTAVKEMVIFIINLLTSTYVCLITLAIGGSLQAAIALISEVTEFLNKTLPAIGDEIGDAVDSFQAGVNKLIGSLNSIPFSDSTLPKLNISDKVRELENFQIPSSFTDDLTKLNSSIPDFKDVQNFTNSVISLPFDKVKELIQNELDTYSFDRSRFPIPQKEKFNFCSEDNGINNFFDGLVKFLQKSKKIFMGIAIVLAIAVCAPMAYWEISRFRSMEQRSSLVRSSAYDPMDVIYIASRPHTAGTGIKLASRFKSIRKQTVIRWAIAYATSPPALFILSLGIAGLLSCICQMIILRAIESKAPALSDEVANFTAKVTFALTNASESWQNGTNLAIQSVNDDINNKVFSWVNDSTTAVNNTLNAFVDTMSDALTTTFGGTVLYEPVKGVLNCLLLLKIEGVQKGLTWVSENAQVTFPQVPADTFSLKTLAEQTDSDSDDDFLLNPSDKTANEISQVLSKLVSVVESGIRQEMIIAGVLIGIWLFVALIGLTWAFTRGMGSDKTRAEGGQAYPLAPEPSRKEPNHYAPKVAVEEDTPSPPYEYPVNKAAPYTLPVTPFPRFDSSSYEKSGAVNQHADVVEPTQLRKSNYGHMGVPSPLNEKNPDSFPSSSR